jgi:hypothetical protein
VIPHRQGSKLATWTWGEDGKLVVAGVDGLTDELALRPKREVVAAAPRRTEPTWGFPAWAPWNQDQSQYGQRSDGRPRPRTRQKSLFEMLFGN